MKRQGLIITINQLFELIEQLSEEFEEKDGRRFTDDNRKFQINIINKTPKCSDTWEVEFVKQKDSEVVK